MTFNGWLQILIFIALVILITKPIGIFLTHVFTGERTFLHPLLRPIERLIFRVTGVDETREMRWTEYAAALLLFSAVSLLVLYALQRLQGMLPLGRSALLSPLRSWVGLSARNSLAAGAPDVVSLPHPLIQGRTR